MLLVPWVGWLAFLPAVSTTPPLPMFKTPSVGMPVQYLQRQGGEPLAALVTEVLGSGPGGEVTVQVFPPPGHPDPRVQDLTIPHVDASGPRPVYPCWRVVNHR